MQRYRDYRALLGAFQKRARIEQAKGILMERHGLAPQQAFDRLRSEARRTQRPLIELVDEILGSGTRRSG